jgi:hypothetical protein
LVEHAPPAIFIAWHIGAADPATQTDPGTQHTEPIGQGGCPDCVEIPMHASASVGRSAHTPSLPAGARVLTFARASLQYCVLGH